MTEQALSAYIDNEIAENERLIKDLTYKNNILVKFKKDFEKKQNGKGNTIKEASS